MDDAVDHGGGHLVVPEHRSPPAELQIRGDYHRLSLVCVGEDLEEQPRPVRVEREKPELIDDEQASLADERGLPVELPVVTGAPQAHHKRGRREEACLESPLARQRAEGRRHLHLADAPPPNNNFRNAPQACAPALQAITTLASAWRAPFRHEGPTGCPYLKLQGTRTRKAARGTST